MGTLWHLQCILILFCLSMLDIKGIEQTTADSLGTWEPGTAYITRCDFNNNSRPFCDWTQPCAVNQGVWIRTKHATPTEGTGPDGGYPDRSGYFIYQEASNLIPFDVNRLESPSIVVYGDICIDFWYHMLGSEDQNGLKVIVQDEARESEVWSRRGNQSSSWLYGFKTVPFEAEKRIKVIFEAVRGLTEYGDTAVDNVGVRRGLCETGTSVTPTTTLSTSTPMAISTTIPTDSTSTPETTTPPPGPSSESCVAEGDPHYLTFDKQMHHFMGTCTYTLSKLCAPNSTLPYFNVEATNEHRGGYTHVSYVRDVAVDVYGHRITLKQGRAVTVNGKQETLPWEPSTSLTVSSSGMYVVVATDFGLRVRFDGNHRAEVMLPSTFKAQVCGMCGNYNQNPADDFLNPQGGMEPDSTSLGNSWQVSNHSSCPPALPQPPMCNQTTQQLIGSSQYCGLLKEGTGPFKQCHAVLRPDAYFNNCAYDLCALQLEPGALCRSLQSYADACQSLGVTVAAWRNATFCPIQCPANSHYEPCATACPATCARPMAPATCGLPCVEGCVCDTGYLLYNDRCVPSGQCGCWHEDRHYPIGYEFWTDDTCSKKCRCPAVGSKLSCAVASCPQDHYCGVQYGVPGCYRYTYGICRVHNDPHYNTFDKATHHFMGTCTYTLAKVCGNDSALPIFNVEAKNEHRGNPWVSYVQRVRVEAYGQRIDIVRNHRNQVLVNGEWTNLPVMGAGGSIQVSRSGRYTVLETDFGLSVSYDTDHSVEVKVPSTYSSRTCGMCGNFNGRRDDEYMKPDGQQAANSNELGKSWKVEDGDPSCSIPPAVTPPPPCTAEQERLYQSAQYCGIMTSQVGAFTACHSVINPESFAESCVFDLCALNGSEQQLCGALEAYADACQGAGVMLPSWRNATFCPLPCPGNSHYNPYTSACPATCFNPMAPSNCSKPCVEGCQCNTGFVLSGEQCVPISDCGCLHQGRYYKKDETFWQADCKGKCTCAENGTVICSNETCEADHICKVQKGTLGCYPPDTATCHIYGDPHYVTFDGRLYHFQGGCNYTIVQPCANSSEPFSVTTRNEHRGSPAWTALNSVSVTLKNVHVAVRKNKEVQVNGIQVALPVSLPPGISVALQGAYVVVDTPIGIQVKFDGDHEIFVRADERLRGQLCGLCGTYTENQLDDFLKPDHRLEQDSTKFGDSWRVKNDNWTCGPTAVPPDCDLVQEREYEELCKIIVVSSGPFVSCHWPTPPQQYFESCVYDLCATGGDTEQFCKILGAYAAACELGGVSLGDWTKDTVCAPEPPCDLSCSFDTNFCNWDQLVSDNLDWIRHRGPTLSPNTGPSFDHTTGAGYFIYLRGSEAQTGDVAGLVSPVCASQGHHCFHFWYHMYGVAQNMTLRVYVIRDGARELLWKESGNKGDRWNEAQITVYSKGSMKILLEGERGHDFRSDVAVDDVSLEQGCCPGDCVQPPTPTIPSTTTLATASLLSSESCVAEGDPHYLTFDKQMHHFMGTCTYTLSKLCAPNSTLPYFNVEATNEHRGGYTHVSYVRDVAVDVYGHRITLEKGRAVTVDGEQEILPFQPATGLTVFSSGMYVVVATDFGLRVRFDGNHRVEVTLPSTFKAQVCGMCGNYNQNPADDFLNPQGGMEPDSTSLGNSWQVSNHSSCPPALPQPPMCNQTTQQLIGSSQYCGLLKEGTGPFKQCHAVLRPDAYFNNCAYDLCALQLEPGALCRSLQSYADACQSLGVTVAAWRNATFCPIQCPANSHYEPCATACPATCARPMAPATCGLPCVEGCVCDTGHLLYNDRCVPSGQCGCWHEDRHYPIGYEFWTDDTCSKKCRCPAAGSKLSCAVASCPRDYYCGVQNGVPGCYPYTYGICRVHNDPHYNTFDKATHHFMGTCTYTLAKVCGNISALPAFNVEAKNEHRGNPWVSYVQRVRADVYGLRIEIVRNHRSRVLVNGEWTTLPVTTAGGSVRVSRSGRYTVLETDFGLSVSYDTDHSVEVKVPSTYSNRTCGMCGNFNGRRDDEYMKPDGQQAANSNELGESWKVEDGDPSCSIPPTITPPPPCTAEQERLYQSAQYCGMMSSQTGALVACHSVINPESFVESCVFDLCALNGSEQQLCGALEAYADACQGAGVILPSWRNATFCPPACPLNAHYESCATACPATCVDRLAPQNCSKLCLEACVCNTGFVLSGGDCVPEAQCGCVWDGRYYSEGQTVVTEDCTRRCQCLGSGQMNCSAFSCGAEEVCKLQDGQRGCFVPRPEPGTTTTPTPTAVSTSIPPTSSSTILTSTPETTTSPPVTSSESCVAEGDPHYLTFDKQMHHFMGTCTYTLSKLCAPNSTLPYFNVEATNEHRGGYTHVSYVRDVAVDVYGHRITLEKGRAVTVDGEQEILPFQPATGLTVFSSGMYVVVATDFGLRVRFDGNHRVEVTLPSTFKAQVCGMCGNYNQNPADDFLNPQGGMEPDSTSLGNSWQVSNHSSCPPALPQPPMCNQTTQQLIGSSQYCGLLKEGTGPFKQCHAVLRPDAYFNNCAYDLCALQLEPGALCRSLQSYADACQSLGVTVAAWRNATFCPIQCPANSHYEPCATACPATCARPMAPATCGLPCVEGCVCDTGHLLYNDRCVPSGQCGCWHEDRHYPIGYEFWTDDTCSKKCRCPAAGSKLSCAVASCPRDYYCGVQNGVPGCYPYTYGICRVHNDPHYNTFDKATHHFMGTCTYTLAKVCGNISALPAFNVEAKNEHRGNPWVSYVQRVRADVYGLRIEIVRNHRSRVLVNGEWTTLPVTTAGGSVRVSRSGRYTVLETDFGLSVSYDTDHSVEVKVPSTYSNRTCGMCGNFNGRRDDEYMKPDGQQAANSNELGESWKVEDGDPSCSIPPTITPPPPCTAEQERLYQSAQYCGMMSSQTGALVACHSVINPESFVESCVFDLCALNGSEQQLCGALEAYADACQGAGVILPSWRNATFCPPACPLNAHYESCATACPATCVDRLAPQNCSKLCLEACVCNTGFVLSGGDCVPEAQCGCVWDGRYYSEGQTVVTEDCTRRCQCLGSGQMNCSAFSCGAEEVCKLQDGQRGCFVPRPEPGTTTTPTPTAVSTSIPPTSSSTILTSTPETTTSPPVTSSESCVAEGDPHYLTFDKQMHHFMGTCTYTLSKLCAPNSTLPYFNVEATNEHRGGYTHVSYVRDVAVDVYGHRITLEKGRAVTVDGEQEILPFQPATGLTVFSSGMYVVVATDFGLRVRFDGNHRVEVTLPSTFKAQVCGMCGNYNQNPADDFLNPQGGMEPDSTSLGNSWQVSNHSSCPPALPQPPMCNQTTQQLIGSSQYCGLLKEGTGPFKQCHAVLRPDAYFNNCAYDLCALQLEPGALCRSLQSYADACQSLGVTVAAWRNATFCPIQCPANSHYEPCATACPATCARPMAPATCGLPCVEGCVCDTGHLLYNDRCVPSGQCGCWHEDRHYPIGYEFWTDDTCSKKCRCPAAGSKLSCAVASCPPDHYCGLQYGVPGCYRYTYGICRVHNDPHYNTFDKVTHHFMGTCTYTLAKVCGNISALPVFNVEAKNEHRGNPWVSYVQRVRAEVYGLRIDIVRNHRNQVLVNGEWTNLPVMGAGGSIQVSRSGRYTVLETDFGLSVSYDTDHSVEVKVPSTYSSRTCGMCGNFNGRRDDEYMKPDGQQAANSNELGKSWKVEDGDPSCSIPPAVTPPPPCTAEQERLYQSAQYCGIMTSQVGAFTACHSVINPESFAESCVFDLCALNGSEQQLCGALEAYADACQGAGVMLPSWRNATFCPLPCPGNSHYNPYTSACPATCFNPMAPSNCSKPCVEGCQCNTGFVLSGEQCVPISDCGCLHQGRYYKKDETFWQADCKGKCTCAENGTVICSNETCEADHICKVQKGTLGCYPPDTATCHIYGDPHYVTFDGRLYHFQGGCNYTIVQPCANSSEPFSVTTRNEHRGSPAWTALNSVSVTLKNVHVAVRKNKEVQVNGIQVALPVSLPPGISVALQGAYVVVDTPIGIQVKFDGDHEIFVRADERLRGQLCGLCGTYTENQLDDFLKPDHRLEQDSTKFGDSWRVKNDNWTCGPTAVPPDCDLVQEREYEELCKIIVVSSGPFVSCHWSTPPQQYFESCVYDLCATGGDTEQFCKILGAYAAACELGGVSLGDWTKDTVCGNMTTQSPSTTTPTPAGMSTYSPSPSTMTTVSSTTTSSTSASTPLSTSEPSTYSPSSSVTTTTSGTTSSSTSTSTPLSTTEPSTYSPSSSVTITTSGTTSSSTSTSTPLSTTEPSTYSPSSSVTTTTSGTTSSSTSASTPLSTTEPSTYSPSSSVTTTTSGTTSSSTSASTPLSTTETSTYSPSSSVTTTTSGTTSSSTSASTPLSTTEPSTYSPSSSVTTTTSGTTSSYTSTSTPLSTTEPSTYSPNSSVTTTTSGTTSSSTSTSTPLSTTETSTYSPSSSVTTTTSGTTSSSTSTSTPLSTTETSTYSPSSSVTTTNSDTTSSSTSTSTPLSTTKPSTYSPSSTATTTASSTSASTPSTTSQTTPKVPPLGRAICSASGDPHYNTFDQKVHHFMGTCTYTLSKVCNASTGLLPFAVSATNEHRGSNTKVSYVKSVHVEVYDNQISLLKNRKVNVNGRRVNLPVFVGSKIKILSIGGYILLETDFGLRVRFDGNHYAEVSVPSNYQGQLCGLCGNYNNNPGDDNIKPDGYAARDSTELGDSWIVPEDNTACSSEPPGTCDPKLESEVKKNTACGMISDPAGVFKDCHAKVNWENFFSNCIYDMCHTGGQAMSLCYGLQAYAEACSSAGICIKWRNATLCPISCPAHSQYDSCNTMCPLTCSTPSAPSSCSSPPMEGCFCSEGYLLSGDKCVPRESCGCIDTDKKYHQVGESWFTRENCTERCTCNNHSNITCAAWKCGIKENCNIQDGVLGCHASGSASCQVVGDPHYFTFDKAMLTFLGTCTYTLVETCNSNSVVPVTIRGKNEDRGQRGATYLKEVYIDVYDNRITLQKSRSILLNKERVYAPVKNRMRGVSIGNVGLYVVVETDFGLVVKYDGNHHLEISLPDSYFSKVCGMCGNYNGRKEDELLMPNHLQASNVAQFGNSWKVEADSEQGCLPDKGDEPNPPCTAGARPNIEKQCRALMSDPFKQCHHLVDPELFIKTCVYDMCKYGGMKSTLCAIVQAYVDTCKKNGESITWRNNTFCPLPCPSHSHYTPCAPLCPATCNDIFGPTLCEKPGECTEGCVCNNGYVLSNDRCVPLRDCGCRDNKDNYYSVGDSWVTEHCSKKCRCRKENVITCRDYTCEIGSVCTLHNGKYKCKPTGFGKCLVTGDPHYLTFDGLWHHFQGKSTYVLAQTIPEVPTYLPPFSIEGKNQLLPLNRRITFLKEVRVNVYNHTVMFKQKKKLVVDGVSAIPPARPHEGIQIFQRATRIYMQTDFGLSLSYDGSENLDITLANTYKNKVEGLCGNFDNKYRNDFTKPDGSRVRNVNVFGESWKVPVERSAHRLRRAADDESDTAELETGLLSECSESQLIHVNSTSNCRVLVDPDGPFQACHSNVSADSFLQNCLYDMCVEPDNKEMLCRDVEQYALVCQESGITVQNWRERTSCAPQCPPNSKYSICTSACPVSCGNLAAASECDLPCVEGCECLPGYILSGFDCVPYKECGCTFLNQYYKVGETFRTEDCSQTCECTESSSVSCIPEPCGSELVCGIANLTRGCYRSSPCLHNPCQNDGICIPGSGNSSFSCICPDPYMGPLCEKDRADAPISPGTSDNPLVYIIVGVAVGVVVLALIISLVLWGYRRKRNDQSRLGSQRSSSLNYSTDALDQGAGEQDYGFMVNAAFDERENQPHYS